MTQFLVLRLTDPVTWVVVDAAGARVGPVTAGAPGDAAPLATERRVIVIAPSTDIVLAEPELPVKSGPRLAQVVPYALEDSLAGDIDQFHFALGRRQNRPGTPTAVVERARLEGWLETLRGAGLTPEALVPESLCLPDNPGKTVVLIESGRLFVRPPGQLPFALDAEPLTEAFALAGLESEDRYLQVYVAQADWEACRPAVEALREVSGSLDVQLLADGALPLLASVAATAAPLSLLQGPYAPRTGVRAHWQRWRLAAALAGALLVVHSGAAGFHWWQQSREEKRLDAAIEQTFRAAMPDVGRMVDPRAQMEQRLRGSGAPDPDGLLARLAALGSAVTGVPSTSLESLNWQERALDLKIVAPSTEALAGITRAMGERGVAAQVQSTSPRGSAVEGRLVVRAGGTR